MRVTLRNAHKLIEKIAGRLGTLQLSAAGAVNIWDETPIDDQLKKLLANYNEQLTRQLDLLNARQEIRTSIQAINANEINGLVAIRKGLLDQLATLRHIQGTIVTGTSTAALTAKIASERANPNRYGGESITVSVLDDAAKVALDKKINALQLRVEAVEDQLSTSNATAGITLTAELVMVLRREGIVQ